MAPPSVNTHTGTHTHTHTHTHLTIPTTMSILETPFDIHVSSVYQTHTCMQAPIPTPCISAKKTHNKESRIQPIMSILMPRSGILVICSRATLSCYSSYLLLIFLWNHLYLNKKKLFRVDFLSVTSGSMLQGGARGQNLGLFFANIFTEWNYSI